MQNREMIMHKVGKWFMIIGIAGLLSLLFIEWSRWNLVSLAEKINLVAVSENYHEFHTKFIEVGIATFSIFALFAAPSLVRWDSRSAINVTLLLFAIVIDAAAIISVIAKGKIFENYVLVIVLSMCIYVKNVLEMIQKLYHWITTGSEENHYDIVKMTFIWTIIAFIIGKIW